MKISSNFGINIALRKEQRDRKFIQRVEVFGILFALAAIIIGSSGDFPIKTIAQAKHNPIGDFLSVYLFYIKVIRPQFDWYTEVSSRVQCH